MNIALLSSQLPSSSAGAGCPRLYHLFRTLSKHHNVSLITTAKIEQANTLNFFKDVFELDSPEEPTWIRKQLHRLALAPYTMQRYRNPDYVSATAKQVGELVGQIKAEVLYIHGVSMTQYCPTNSECKVVVDLVDSARLLYRRMAIQEESWLKKLLKLQESIAHGNWEARAASEADLAITISSIDRDEIKKHSPSAAFEVVPNGVDFDFFQPSGQHTEANALVFTGVMSYTPNADAAIWFAKNVFPRLLIAHPELEFWIVGKDPGPEVQELASTPGITVTGTVEDIRPYLEKAKIFISPLQFGAGMKNKILNAMAMHKAIVATPLSIEGIDVHDGSHLLLAETTEQWVESIEQLLSDPALCAKIAQAGFELTRSRYSWDKAVCTLEESLNKIIKA